MITRESVERSGWPVEPLGDAVEFLDGRRKPVKECDRTPGPYIYYGANGPQGTIDGFLFDEPTVLLAEDGGFFGDPTRTIAYQVSGKYWVNNHAHVLQPKQRLDIRFLCRQLEQYDVTPFVNGTTRGKLTKGAAERIPIAVPPLPEQKRIAAVLDQADALRAKRRQAIAKLDTLLQSVFLDMFGDGQSKNDYPRLPLEAVCTGGDGVRCGPFGSQITVKDLRPTGVPFWGLRHVAEGFRQPPDEFVDPRLASRLQEFTLRPGDVVMTRRGTVGKVSVLPVNRPSGIMHSGLLRIRVDPSVVYPEFLSAQLNLSSDVKAQMRVITGGAIMPAVNVGKLKGMRIVCPPLDEQKAFLGCLNLQLNTRTRLERSESQLDRLFDSLQCLAFDGSLFAEVEGARDNADQLRPSQPLARAR